MIVVLDRSYFHQFGFSQFEQMKFHKMTIVRFRDYHPSVIIYHPLVV